MEGNSNVVRKEKYLSIKVSVRTVLFEAHKAIVEGRDVLDLAVFDNSEAVKKNVKSPVFKNDRDGVAVWVNKKQDKPADSVSVEEVDM